MKKHCYPLLAAAALLLGTASLSAQTIVGITSDNRIFRMTNPATPSVVTTPVQITGLAAGQTVAGADFRPNTGELYLLGYDNTNGNSQLYTADYTTGVATPIGTAPIMLALGTGSIGFDFNPTVDRIRVTGANRKNYRLHPVTGAIAATDGDLAYAAGDANAASQPTIGAVAYTNSYIGSEATTLYNYDEALNVLTIQNPPNNGTLNTVGSSGITANTSNRRLDMDIYFDPATMTNKAYLAGSSGILADMLYSVNLTTGAASPLGVIGTGLGIDVKDIAVLIDRTIPANISGQLVYGLTRTNRNLIAFDSDQPGIIRSLSSITGLTMGQTLVGMDFRPADRMLYGLGYNSGDNTHQLYRIDAATGAATAINATAGTGLSLGSGTQIGFDFNPTVDRIRVVSSNGNNYRLHPGTGAIAATDTALTYAAGDANSGRPARVGSVAYVNSYAGATSTTLYGIDDSLGALVSIVPPNGGVLNTLGMLSGLLNAADYTTDLDFYYDSASMTNIGYLVANPGSMNDKLYRVSTNGSTTLVGDIGMGVPLTDIAVQLRYAGPAANGVNHVEAVRLSAWPVPVRDVLQVQLPAGTGTIELRWLDMSGRLVRSAQLDPANGLCTANAAGLLPGTYTVQIRSAGTRFAPLVVSKL